MGKAIRVADLFCGAGGTSTGMMQAAERRGLHVDLTAVNHWDRALETHALNHPAARHEPRTLDEIDPRKLFPRGLDVIMASPECTNHSRAKSGKPKSDQSRATAWHVPRWVEALQPTEVLVENVPEFQDWGPLGQQGAPIASQKGRTWRAWVTCLRSLGYRVEWRVLTCADYGDPTTRQRLFLRATKGRGPVYWPDPSHSRTPELFTTMPWRPASEIIDWSLPIPSIFMTRDEAAAWGKAHGMRSPKRPLAEKTMARIAEGLRRFVFESAEPFIVMPGHGCERFRGQGIGEPLGTQGGSNRFAVVDPFVMPIDHRGSEAPGAPVGMPLSAITTKARHSLIVPWMVKHYGGAVGTDLQMPVPTITGRATQCNLGVAWLQRMFGTAVGMDLREPHPTVLQGGHSALTMAFLTKYYGSGGGQDLRVPLGTVTGNDRFGLATVMIAGEPWQIVDIGMRMLQPHELAAAMGFPQTYRFAGTNTEIVKQIGNAVPVTTAEHLSGGMLASIMGRAS